MRSSKVNIIVSSTGKGTGAISHLVGESDINESPY